MGLNFNKQFGKGTDPWYAKARRWAKKQRFPISFLALGIIEWLKQKWIDVKIANTMREIDRQSEEIKKIWEEKDKFDALMKKSSDQMIKLASIIEDQDDFRAALKQYMWSSCKACHSRYRATH